MDDVVISTTHAWQPGASALWPLKRRIRISHRPSRTVAAGPRPDDVVISTLHAWQPGASALWPLKRRIRISLPTLQNRGSWT